ncbi:IclR family transcriptional regulator [Arthrobacter halodurans]|uniref:IclR family transcriptional regulator n=1 Tax=Arthrobacter halodurans TaxID=516699 RepID=A0ABV4UJB3_9MICC
MANPTPRRPKSTDGPAAEPQSTVTAKALSLLGAFGTEHSRLSLSDMARRSGLPVATAHRLAAELVAWGALERAGAAYVVGHRIWRLGLLAPARQNIAELAAPYMQDVLFVTQNVVNLFIIDGGEVLLLERISGTRAGLPFRRVGARMPLHASAAGKVFMAYGPEDVRALPTRRLEPQTEHTITDPAVLKTEIERVRAQGFATTSEEAGLDNYAVAVPVLTTNGTCTAALGVVAQGEPPSVGTVVPVLRIAARSIARRLASSSDY